MRFAFIVLGLGLGVGLTACGTDVDDSSTPPPPTARATWYQDVGPIVSKHCMSCHQPGGIAPFSLTDLGDARDNAPMMIQQITANTMPPFGASEESDCTPRFGWTDDPRLSEQEKTTIQWWMDDGLAAGTEADVPVPAGTGLSGVTQTLAPTQPFTAAGTRDQFICTVLDPGVTTWAWLTGLQVRPGNPLVVHHAVIAEVFPTGANADAIASQTTGVPWDCSTEQLPADLVVNSWTPGNTTMETPAELAVPVLAGAKFVLQIHYHPAGTIAEPDTTSLDLRTSPTWPQKMYFVGAFGNASATPELLPDPDDRTTTPEFRIPADVADHQEHMEFTVGDLGTLTNVQFYSVNPHMHLIGTHINSTIVRPAARGADPQTECLANGSWNFDWQRTYQYNVPIAQLPTVQAGDVIDVNCHWDNTLSNPFEQRALADAGLVAPVDVTLGEGQSTDEMCLEIFGISTDAPAMPAGFRSLTVDQMPSQLLATMSRLNVQ
jgi:hypothetical protein